jgi:hypothetical protein
MNMDRLSTFYARTGYAFTVVAWVGFGGIAALWWVPQFMGEAKPIPWAFGAWCLLLLWVLVLNQWPRLGTRRFFREYRSLKIEIPLLVGISVLFGLGFVVVA